MQVEFIWASAEGKEASTLVGSLIAKTGAALKPIDRNVFKVHDGTHEMILLEIPALTTKDTRGLEYCVAVAEIQRELEARGVTPKITVNGGFTLLQYAGQQEILAEERLNAISAAAGSLRAMRKWFKNSELANIRRKLEKSL